MAFPFAPVCAADDLSGLFEAEATMPRASLVSEDAARAKLVQWTFAVSPGLNFLFFGVVPIISTVVVGVDPALVSRFFHAPRVVPLFFNLSLSLCLFSFAGWGLANVFSA